MPSPVHANSMLQEREVQRYYQPWLAAQGSSLRVASHVESIAQVDLAGRGYKPRNSRDKALTAFAQLAALKLDVTRAMVSLIDSSNQYILAEATQNLAMSRAEMPAQEDGIWLGTTTLVRQEAVCEHCFHNTYKVRDPEGQDYVTRALVIEDCRLDDRFKDRSYVREDGGVRFYAGVPIYSRDGYMIGAYAVSKSSPRPCLTYEEVKTMEDISQAVTEHLEWARDRVDRFKGERLVRGMATFIETCSSARGQDNGRHAADEASAGEESEATESVGGTMKKPSPSGTARHHTPKHTRPSENTTPERSSASPASRRSRPTPDGKAKKDSLSRMFDHAVNILRDSALADGAAIFGLTADLTLSGRHNATSQSTDSGSPDNTSDSDGDPARRACKLLASCFADDRSRKDISQNGAISLGTLEKYMKLFPKGKAFHFHEQGATVSSEDDGMSDPEPPSARQEAVGGEKPKASPRSLRYQQKRMNHVELLRRIPGAKSVIFLPLYDHNEERWAAGCFLWTSVTGRMMSLDADMSYLRAFGNSIMSEVARIRVQKNEAAKTSFIASVSHELRSPLHGILGASEFLLDTASDSYQVGLVTSIRTCGQTLLDTMTHLLDWAKINRLDRNHLKKQAKNRRAKAIAAGASTESLNLTAEVDLGILVEEVVEAISAGHSFRKIQETSSAKTANSAWGKGHSTNLSMSTSNAQGDGDDEAKEDNEHVVILLDIIPRQSWLVNTQPGALRRIIMNLLGNALKYTTSGFVAVSLRAQESEDGSKLEARFRVVDSGKGMSEDYLRNYLYVAFSQEDPFQPGTGLGLSIVKQIVDSLGGTIDLQSQKGVGTEVDVRIDFKPSGEHTVVAPEEDLLITAAKTKGLTLALLDPHGEGARPAALTSQRARLEATLTETCTGWFEMRVVKATSTHECPEADVYLYSEPPPVRDLLERHRDNVAHSPRQGNVPMILVCSSAEEAIQIAANQSKALRDIGRIVEVVPQPCGPRKLAKVLNYCLRRSQEAKDGTSSLNTPNSLERMIFDPEVTRAEPKGDDAPQVSTEPSAEIVAAVKDAQLNGAGSAQSAPLSAAVSFPTEPPYDPATPSLVEPTSFALPTRPAGSALAESHVLCVDDNRINLQLLTMFMKKCKISYETAENGQEAVDKYRAANARRSDKLAPSGARKRFNYILMDINMPIMNGLDATKAIRDLESEEQLRRCTVIALTGLASAQAQVEAETAGVDVFMAKPVKFAELQKLLVPRDD